MNKLPWERRAQILNLLVEGSSLRSISRVAGVSINTVTKLLVNAGQSAAAYHDAHVRNVAAKKIQCDEIWSFCYAKQRNTADAKAVPDGAGNVWTFTALEAETKLMVSWMVGDRDGTTAYQFLSDLKDRITDRIQLTTDGFPAYADAVSSVFGDAVDYAMLVKIYGQPQSDPRGTIERRYSPPGCIGRAKHVLSGEPNYDAISTSHIERQNLTMRMSMRRFTRLTNAFSKKFENHCHSLALYFCWYNWMRKHRTLGTTPAIAAGITDKVLTMADVASLIDMREQSQIQERRAAMLAPPTG